MENPNFFSTAIEILTKGNILPAIALELERDPRLKSHNTRRGYLNDLTQFEGWRNGRPWSRMLVQEYLAHLQHSDRASRSIKRNLAAIRWWVNKVVDLASEYPAFDPSQQQDVFFQGARIANIHDVQGKTQDPPGRHISYDEIDALMRTCANDHTAAGIRDLAIIALVAATGMRRAELAGLRLESIEVKENAKGMITIRGKGDKERKVPVFGGTVAALNDWLTIRGQDPGPLFYEIRRERELPEHLERSYNELTAWLKSKGGEEEDPLIEMWGYDSEVKALETQERRQAIYGEDGPAVNETPRDDGRAGIDGGETTADSGKTVRTHIAERREQVAKLKARGMTYLEIAEALSVSRETVQDDLQAMGLTRGSRKG